MSVESVAASLPRIVGLVFAAAGVVGVLYLSRRWLIRIFVRKGLSVVERFLEEILRDIDSGSSEWVLVPVSEKIERLGLVVARKGNHMAVFLPTTPQLIPGELVFVPVRSVLPVRGLNLSDGMEALSTLGVMSERDVLARILSQMGE